LLTATPTSPEVDLNRFKGPQIRLETFDGPLDLLLDIIKKNKEEIWEISIAKITQQYLDYITTLTSLNIEVAGEFLVMAATLMRIKSQMLLPRPSFLGDEDEDGDPLTKEGLIARLLEYRRFKEVGQFLKGQEHKQGERYHRGTVISLERGFQLPLREPRLIDLLDAFDNVLQRGSEEPRHEVDLEEVDLDEQIEWVRSALLDSTQLETGPDGETGVPFQKLLRQRGAIIETVVTFLAVLELAKLQRLSFWQLEALSEIWLNRADPPQEPALSDVDDGQLIQFEAKEGPTE